MSVHKNYPDGCAPSAGPFKIEFGELDEFDVLAGLEDPIVIDVSAGENGFISMSDQYDVGYDFTPSLARELAAALIECADHIDRAAMTPKDVAEETAKRR